MSAGAKSQMSRNRNKITKMNRKTDRARRRKQAEQLSEAPVKVLYDRDRGIGKVPDNLRRR